MNPENTRHITYMRRKSSELTHVFLSESRGEGQVIPEEELLKVEEEENFEIEGEEEMRDINGPLGGSVHGLFVGSRSDRNR